MWWKKGATLVLASAALVEESWAQVVTITEYPSTCTAIYTSGSSSVTVVQSTVMVSPTPWSDAAANSGEPFVLQLESSSSSKGKRQNQAVYIAANGNTTLDATQAALYTINGGQMSLQNGGPISTDGMGFMVLSVAASTGSITQTISVQSGQLNWANSAFNNSLATFYKVPAGQIDNAETLVYFNGPTDPTWGRIAFAAAPGTLRMTMSTIWDDCANMYL
jgi:hypothetical protein